MATRAASLTAEFRRSFEDEWPELARRLERFLAGKGVEAWLRADVVQETGTRIYNKWPGLDRSRSLWNLVVTIALGVVVDERRKASHLELIADVPEVCLDDVETRALHRLHLSKTSAALDELRQEHRRVLLAEIGEADALAGSRNRINVTRLRARSKLREALGPWAFSAITIRLRYLRDRFVEKMPTIEMHLPAVTSSIIKVATTATLGLVGLLGTVGDAAMSPRHGSSSSPVAGLHAIAGLRTLEARGLPVVNTRAGKDDVEWPGWGDDAPGSDEGVDGWVARRRGELGDREREVRNLAGDGKDLADDGVNLVEDGKALAEDGVNLADDVRDVAEEWVHGRRKEVAQRVEEAEDMLRPLPVGREVTRAR